VAVIDQGRIVESGPVTEVFLHPEHAVTRSLLAEDGLETVSALANLREQAQGPLVRLTFVGDATYQPVLSRATQETGSHFNILQGTIGRIKNIPYGQLLVELVGNEDDLPPVLNIFSRENVRHEVLV